MANNTPLYYDFHHPLPLVQLILKMLGRGDDPTQNQLSADTNREWFSQPRVGTDKTTECVTVAFRLPLSVSEIRTDILRMPCVVEVWYQDRSNNWRPVLNPQRSPLKARIDRSDTKSWFKWSTRCYPIVAKKLQLRLTRYNDGVLDSTSYPLGVRNTLIRRNVYERSQGGFFEDELDVMGNTVSKYVRDWDASKAADDNYTTFWRSAPQPDPAAVVSLYLDVRDQQGKPQVIDKVYIDPVYSGAHLNLYYSSDSSVGTRLLSPITLPPPPGTEDNPTVLNIDWRYNRGLTDTSTGTDEGYYSWPMAVGPHIEKNAWIGVDWRPKFGTASDPSLAHNPVLYSAGDPQPDRVSPSLSYDPANRVFQLEFLTREPTALDGTPGDVISACDPCATEPISQEWDAGESIKIVAGWTYHPSRVWIRVVDVQGRTIASFDEAVPGLPQTISFDGINRVANFRGSLASLVLKLESYSMSSEAFLASPTFYCDPDPVIPDQLGNYPSTTLDNAIYVAPWLSREHGSGGSDQSHFENKEWTPIWRDYVAVKGMLHFPQPISMQYLKMEFTNLSEQPYPIYESGIEVKYKVFPVSVTQTSSIGPRLVTGTGGFLGMGSFISMNGVRSVNWLDPTSVMRAVGSVLGPQVPPVVINAGLPYLTDTLPNQGAMEVENTRRVEAASSYVYPRETLQPYILATDQYNTLIKAEGLQAIQPYVDVPWTEIEAANPGAVTKVRSEGTLPVRGTDWWIYPGQQLKVPASVMRKLTDTQTITERKYTLETRSRFNTTQVHRYEWQTVRRDAGIAYFAGLREVQPYISTFVAGEDTPVYKFPSYSDDHWVATNIERTELGPVTAAYPSTFGVLTSKELISQSDFSKVKLEFRDSGLARSNPMWVDIDQNVETIDDIKLSPYFGVIPDNIPQSSWADALANWADIDTVWGSSYGLVSINVDNERRYQGKRVVHFTRAAESGQAGISLKQWTNYAAGAKFRVGAVFFRPKATQNQIILRLKKNDGTVILEETLGVAPAGRWFEAVTDFAEVPETAVNSSFSNNLMGWIAHGGSWSAVTDKGFTGTDSAHLETNGGDSTLTTEGIECMLSSTATASCWVSWAGITPGAEIHLNALLYNSDDQLVDTIRLAGGVTPTTADSSGWSPVSGSLKIPTGMGVTQVAFQVVVPSGAGDGGEVWVDDFSTNVPGSPQQQFTAELTVSGDQEEELYVSDLYTETTPIRYYVRLGAPPVYDEQGNLVSGAEPIEVTDLRYTKSDATVTASEPVNQMQVQAVVTSNRAYAYGCTVTPNYLK